MKVLFIFITGLSMLITGSESNKKSFSTNNGILQGFADSGQQYDCCSGNDEDPIIWATVTDNLSNPVSGANVEVFDDATSSSLGTTTTDSNGDFAVRVEDGDYYFEITPVGQSTVTTQVYTITCNTTLNISI